MDTEGKLDLLGDAARFDVSAPGASLSEAMRLAEQRMQLKAGCIFPAQVGGGRCIPVFKVLMSNACKNDCHYCATRCSADIQRQTFEPEELAKTFMSLEQKRLVHGLFLSSGIVGTPERTQEQMLKAVELLRRKHGYRGYIHLKILPGVSDAAVEAAARLASRLSVNLEAPTVGRLRRIAPEKDFREELLRPLRLARELQQGGLIRSGLTTQFVVGGGGDTDLELLTATVWLYREVGLRRAYYSAFRPIRGTPLEDVPATPPVREHRLYQADWLLREYGFELSELVFGDEGELGHERDPKLASATAHPERFPIEISTASREELLRVPGIGPRLAERIVEVRTQGRISGPGALRKLGLRGTRARDFLTFDGVFSPSAERAQLSLGI